MVVRVTLAQEHVVIGRITAFNQFPLQNIEVKAKKAGSSALSDSLGNFRIYCKEKDILKIKPEAFRSAVVNINRHIDTVQINLIFIDSRQNREVATGFGYISENDLGFAVATIFRA